MVMVESGEQAREAWRLRRESLSRILIPTNWWVVTGGPGTGKTTLLEHLAKRGYEIMPEAARVVIDREMAKGRMIEQIRANESSFQQAVSDLKDEFEDSKRPNDLIFWDRGIQDTFAYAAETTSLITISQHKNQGAYRSNGEVVFRWKYELKGIFLLSRLPDYEDDYARIEDDKRAEEIHQLIKLGYKTFGYELVNVPLLSSNPLVSVQRRAQFIIDRMRSVDQSVPDLPIPASDPMQPGLSI